MIVYRLKLRVAATPSNGNTIWLVSSIPWHDSSRKHEAVGVYADSPNDKMVRHVALIRENNADLGRYGASVRVWEMQPPLVANPNEMRRTGTDPTCAAHVVAWLSLGSSEREALADWLAEFEKHEPPIGALAKWSQYTVSLDTADQFHKDERGVVQYRKFSCASFVLAAYEQGMNIALIDCTDLQHVPEVGLDFLTVVYRGVEQRRAREKIGLKGDGSSWRVLLPGYVFHALHAKNADDRSPARRISGLHEKDFPVSIP